jgi:hypothetical protein
MKTKCRTTKYEFQPCGKRKVEGAFNGGSITSDSGGLLAGEAEDRFKVIARFAECFTDYRDPEKIEHTVQHLVSQRVYALMSGYEDLIDHDELRKDVLLAALVGKQDPTGKDRSRKREQGIPLAGKSTLNRMELSPADADSSHRYKKIVLNEEAVDDLLVKFFLEQQREVPKRIFLDADATDDPLHGNQEGKFFHGYYKAYCYMPLYIFCGDFILAARLRPSNTDASDGTVEELKRIVPLIRKAWPEVQIILRGDSGFCREEIMSWCELNGIDYCLGLAKNERLKAEIELQMLEAKRMHQETGSAARVYKDFRYQTLKSWSLERRVVGKAEYLDKGANPRFVVTSLKKEDIDAQTLYEKQYCARGEMENRIKEQQLYLFADRTSTAHLRSNQLRLYFSSIAYVLMNVLRVFGLRGTEMEKSQCHTIRNKLFKIGALVKLSTRRVLVSMAGGYPYEHIFNAAYHNLLKASPLLL